MPKLNTKLLLWLDHYVHFEFKPNNIFIKPFYMYIFKFIL